MSNKKCWIWGLASILRMRDLLAHARPLTTGRDFDTSQLTTCIKSRGVNTSITSVNPQSALSRFSEDYEQIRGVKVSEPVVVAVPNLPPLR